jgi:radical SAM superfamily enzyme
MSKVIEIDACIQCPFLKFGRNGRLFCRNTSAATKVINTEIKKTIAEQEIPDWCPLDNKDDYCESNFNIDRKL